MKLPPAAPRCAGDADPMPAGVPPVPEPAPAGAPEMARATGTEMAPGVAETVETAEASLRPLEDAACSADVI